ESDLFHARPHVHNALRHYNFNNPGAEFDPVKPLMAVHVGFRDEIWFHVNFLARRRDAPPDSPVQHFFSELHYDHFDKPFVETCTILVARTVADAISAMQLSIFVHTNIGTHITCAFCKGNYRILHPNNEEFVCGKKHQKKDSELNRIDPHLHGAVEPWWGIQFGL
ncbi:hypothetical protein BRADI_3g37507v3, partial [Brachypodium distachyon]